LSSLPTLKNGNLFGFISVFAPVFGNRLAKIYEARGEKRKAVGAGCIG
jgi:hypothetical protein